MRLKSCNPLESSRPSSINAMNEKLQNKLVGWGSVAAAVLFGLPVVAMLTFGLWGAAIHAAQWMLRAAGN